MNVRQHAFQLPVDGGECLCVYRTPADAPVTATVLHLPAFGDEMNKARSMTARAARAFAARGHGVLQVDLIGCGDSSGEHADATLAKWIDNARRAIAWLRSRSPAAGPPWLWCLRSGALLAPPLLEDTARDAPLLLWQPTLSGAQQLAHLLRQKRAGELVDARDKRSGTRELREQLRKGDTLETGGYAISSRMADELERATFTLPNDYRGRIAWFEVVASAAPSLSASAQSTIERLRAGGTSVAARALQGPSFWQSVEIEQCEPLIEASIAAFGWESTSALARDPILL